MPSRLYSTKTIIKRGIWTLQRYRPAPDEKHVALFTSRRGGSTWIMEVISANPQFRYVAQPFVAYGENGRWGHEVHRIDYGRFLDPSAEELENIAMFIDGILRGDFVLRAPWRFWKPDFWYPKSRTILKVLQAKALMHWFETRFNLQIIYLLRHPLAQATSVINSGWPPIHDMFLTNPSFCRKHLTDEQRDYCEHTARNGSLLERHVLSWCLDNLVPLREIQGHPSWILLTYEECILKPKKVVDRLAQLLNLGSTEYMDRQMPKPSGTTRISHQRSPTRFGEDQLTKWRDRYSVSEITRAFDILSQLQITAYTADTSLPEHALRI